MIMVGPKIISLITVFMIIIVIVQTNYHNFHYYYKYYHYYYYNFIIRIATNIINQTRRACRQIIILFTLVLQGYNYVNSFNLHKILHFKADKKLCNI